MLKKDNSPLLLILLCAVVMSSLPLLVFGLNPKPGPIEIMQVPTTIAQIAFVFAVVLNFGVGKFFAPMTKIQRILIGTLVLYVLFVSYTSPVPSAAILAPSWIVHIFFFVALVTYFNHADPGRIEIIWTVVGLTAVLHVCAFLIAWAIWPEEIRQDRLPAFDNIRHLGYLLAPAAAVMAVQFITRQDRTLFALFCFVAAVFYILYTGSRGGTIALAAGLTATGIFIAWHSERLLVGRIFILLGVTGMAILVSELLPALPWPPVFGRSANTINQTGSEMLNGRRDLWKFSVLAIDQNWLWGYGPAILGQINEYHGTPRRHPHNIGLQLLLHWGVLGTLLVLGTALSFAPSLMAALRRYPCLAPLPLAAVLTLCIHALVDGGLFYPFSTVIMLIAFASLACIGRQKSTP